MSICICDIDVSSMAAEFNEPNFSAHTVVRLQYKVLSQIPAPHRFSH